MQEVSNPKIEQTLLEFAAKNNISIDHEYVESELQELLKLLKTRKGYMFLNLYDKMPDTGKKKLARYTEKLCGE